jgi:Fic family protein
MESDSDALLHPLKFSHFHFLHRITMMGMLPPDECGVFRREFVHVNNPNVLFPPPTAVEGMMEKFCRDFPCFVEITSSSEILVEGLILRAAVYSHRFVSIHPYADGNGRMSRLIMNLILGRIIRLFI